MSEHVLEWRMSHGYGAEFWEKVAPNPRIYQRALNEAWPPDDTARHIPDRHSRIPVRVRVVWERDGEQWVDGHAIRWTRDHVLVSVSDERVQTIGFWLRPEDVRRR